MGDDDPAYDVDCRANPVAYEIGRGEESVFEVQPSRDELLDLWGYADRETADEARKAIYKRYLGYRAREEFVSMGMTRTYLHTGFTRAMRCARYPGGRKYTDDGTERGPTFRADHDEREAALIYEVWWQAVENDETYQELKTARCERTDADE